MSTASRATLCTCLLALAACQPEVEPRPEVIRPVRYIEVHATSGAMSRAFSGTAHSGTETQLSFRVGGTVESINVAVGQTVAEGDLIATLDASDYELQVQQAQANVSAARAQSRNAEASYERVRGLYENGNASRSDLDSARAASESADAQERAARQQLALAREQAGYCQLTAPIRGAIAAVMVEVNENVSGGRPIVLLTSGAEQQPEVEVAIPEVYISRVSQGSTVTVAFDAIPNRRFEATVTEVGVSSTGMATTYPVTVRLAEANSGVLPGMAAEVTFGLGEGNGEHPRIWLPPAAVGEDDQGRFVYLVEPETGEEAIGVARRRSVTIGTLDGRGLEVSAGLAEGDRVVTAGLAHIHDGMRVRMLPGDSAAPAGEAAPESNEQPNPASNGHQDVATEGTGAGSGS